MDRAPLVPETAGKPLNHPPIPGDKNYSTSMRPVALIDTNGNPGPYPDGPRDPRLVYPRTLSVARPRGQGCSSCKWSGQCRILLFQRNFGTIENEHSHHDESEISPDMGKACESWNIDLPPLDPEAYNVDGLGLGDPVAQGTLPEGATDPARYVGQYGDLAEPQMGQADAKFS